MYRHLVVPILAAAALGPAPLQAQPLSSTTAAATAADVPMMASVDSTLFRNLEYRFVGPSRGGRVTTVAGVASEPRTFYMGEASGGLFKTTDAGESWFPVTDGEVPLGSSGDVRVADSNPDIVYYGTGSDGLRSNVSTGRGVYRSDDAGETWSFAGLYDVGQIGAVRIHPTDPNTVWVAANGDAFKPNPERGVFKTTDGGESWENVLFVSDSTGAMDVELNPADPDVVYAWMSRIEREPWTIISGSHEGGFFKSTDGGESWEHITEGLPGELIGKGNLAVSADDPDRIYALIEAKPGGGVYRSDDQGETWYMASEQPAMIQRPFYYTTLGADPTNADVLYGGAEGWYRSMDGGATFERVGTPHGDNHDIWINPNDGQTMVQANDGGANVSFDGGATWSTQMNQPTAEIYGVWVDDEFPYRLYGAQQDNSTIIIRSDADPFDLDDWTSGPGCETGPIIPHPTNDNVIYASCKGVYEVYDRRTGRSKDYRIGGQSLYGNDARDLILRFQRVSPMNVSPHDPEVLYYGSQHVHRTRNMGQTWETISPDLTAEPECCQGGSGEPITRDVTGEEFFSTLYAIRESLHEPGVIWVGANDGPFHITRDGGQTWTDITPDDLEWGGRVQFIEPSPHRPGSAYYAVYRYLLGDYHPYIYRTDDYGESWTLLTPGDNGIPDDWPTRVVREDPDREGLLYAGTEFGLFVSFDDGANWQPFQQNLPNVPVTDIKVHEKDLVISTQGRAFWILDNVSSLHQITPSVSADQVQLYRPRDGYRTDVATRRPMIEYYLPSEPPGPVRIDIMDAGGELVNSYEGEPPSAVEEENPDDPQQAMMQGRGGRGRFGRRGPEVTAHAGVNRFVWDVRHQAGPTAPPGRYQVRLTVAGESRTQPFEVLIDPRSAATGVTGADLVEQFRHALRVTAMADEVESLGERVEEALEAASGEMAGELQAVADDLFTEEVRYGRPGLIEQIQYLSRIGLGTDQKIGRDAVERYEVLRAELDAMQARVDAILGSGGGAGDG